jgi:hypothetical protein
MSRVYGVADQAGAAIVMPLGVSYMIIVVLRECSLVNLM